QLITHLLLKPAFSQYSFGYFLKGYILSLMMRPEAMDMYVYLLSALYYFSILYTPCLVFVIFIFFYFLFLNDFSTHLPFHFSLNLFFSQSNIPHTYKIAMHIPNVHLVAQSI